MKSRTNSAHHIVRRSILAHSDDAYRAWCDLVKRRDRHFAGSKGRRLGRALTIKSDNADLIALNKAALLRDGMRIYVPRPGEALPAGAAGTPAESRIDINRASEAELVSLPGIGPTTAAKIVRSREAKPFARPEELQTRGLVTARVYSDIKDLVTTR